jgi:hypothetical protein
MNKNLPFREQLSRPLQALQYEEAIQQALLLDILKEFGTTVRITQTESGYSLNYNDGKFEVSTAVYGDDFVDWLRRLLTRKVLKKPSARKQRKTKPRCKICNSRLALPGHDGRCGSRDCVPF